MELEEPIRTVSGEKSEWGWDIFARIRHALLSPADAGLEHDERRGLGFALSIFSRRYSTVHVQ